MTDRQLPRAAPQGGEGFLDPEDLGRVARDHHRARAVDGGDRHPVGQERGHLLLGRLHGGHRTARRKLLHQPAPGRHQARRVVQREHTGHMGRRQLADRMPGQPVRPQAQVRHQPEESRLDSEERGLGETRLVEQRGFRRILRREDDLLERAVQVRGEGRADVVERLGELPVRGIQFAPHPGALAALAGEEERGEGRRVRPAAYERGVVPALGQGLDGTQQAVRVGRHGDGPLGEERAGGGEGVGRVEAVSYTHL